MIAPVLVYPASTTRINVGKPSFATAQLMARITSSLSDLGAALPPSQRNSSQCLLGAVLGWLEFDWIRLASYSNCLGLSILLLLFGDLLPFLSSRSSGE